MEEILLKEARLREILSGAGSCMVAFSGGVDSTYLLAEAVRALGDRVEAVTVLAPLHPRREGEEASALALNLGARHRLLYSDELKNPEFVKNPPDRCYHCKLGRARTLAELAAMEGLGAVFDGTNADDGDDYRPGHRALKEMNIKSPLMEAGLKKADVRELSRRLGLPTWNRPAYACLATRFPYGDQITLQGLQKVEAAEEALNALGLKIFRVRVHGSVARLEVSPEEIALVAGSLREKVASALKSAGFSYVALDLLGYRTGSLNETLKKEDRAV